MNAIYEPKGMAFEYSPLAVNLYSGCGHRCMYCYAPDVTTPEIKASFTKGNESNERSRQLDI